MGNIHTIINVNTNESVTDQKVTTANFRDICRAYLTDPKNFGQRLQVVRNRTAENPGVVIFDVTSIRYSSGQVRMTLFTEFQRQQALHAQTAAKAAEREAAKAKRAEERAAAKAAKAEAAPAAEEPVAEEPAAEEQPKKSKKSSKKSSKIAAE